nr:ATP-grasp domain-containing protein [uncultured Schaedlerella sp.]
MSRILVLPGSQWQIPLVRKIKELGHQAIVVSPEENAPCKGVANEYFQSDIFEIDVIKQYCKENNVEAVMSDECDIAMPVVAELGKYLKVPALSDQNAALYTDKFLMREFCAKHGFMTPEYCLCKTVEDVINFFRRIQRPIIIKPLDSNASHGVFKISTEEELKKYFGISLSFSRTEKAILAERFINGTEFTIDGIVTPNAHYTLAISEKKHFKHNANIANELYFTHQNKDYDYEKMKACNDAFVMKSGLRYGLTHAEYKFEGGNYYLIEIGARGGGNLISAVITQYMSGYDTYKYLIECALGKRNNANFPIQKAYQNRASVLKFFETPNKGGKVTDIRGMDYLEEEFDVKNFHLNFKIGDNVEEAKNDSARIGYYIACSENVERLNTVIYNIQERFQIRVI